MALMYFFGVLRGAQENRVDFPESASINVFCLFVLAQPLCLVIGSYTGMLTYLLTALVSYNFLAWKEPESRDQKAASKEAKKKTS